MASSLFPETLQVLAGIRQPGIKAFEPENCIGHDSSLDVFPWSGILPILKRPPGALPTPVHGEKTMHRKFAPLCGAVIIFLLLGIPSVRGETVSPWKKDAALMKEIMAAENDLMDGVRSRNRSTLEKRVATDFAYVSQLSTGDVMGKDEFVGANLGGIKLDSFRFENELVRGFGDVAIANTVCRQMGSIANRPWSPDYLFTDVWVKRSGHWQIASRHATRPVKIEKASPGSTKGH